MYTLQYRNSADSCWQTFGIELPSLENAIRVIFLLPDGNTYRILTPTGRKRFGWSSDLNTGFDVHTAQHPDEFCHYGSLKMAIEHVLHKAGRHGEFNDYTIKSAETGDVVFTYEYGYDY